MPGPLSAPLMKVERKSWKTVFLGSQINRLYANNGAKPGTQTDLRT
jgi:hypothetical protein